MLNPRFVASGSASRLHRATRRSAPPLRFGLATLVSLVSALAGCGDSGAPNKDDGGMPPQQCIKPLSLDCTPTYEPTYDAIYDNLLRPTCGTSSVCHYGPTADKAQAGLVLSNRDDAYDYLLGMMDGRARVVPNKPECSILEQRLESNDPNFRMPSGGAQLPLGDRCVVRQWIANGAKRK
jgi:hypothetical protein